MHRNRHPTLHKSICSLCLQSIHICTYKSTISSFLSTGILVIHTPSLANLCTYTHINQTSTLKKHVHAHLKKHIHTRQKKHVHARLKRHIHTRLKRHIHTRLKQHKHTPPCNYQPLQIIDYSNIKRRSMTSRTADHIRLRGEPPPRETIPPR